MRRLPILLSCLLAACVAGTTHSGSDPAGGADHDDPGREATRWIGADALLGRTEAAPDTAPDEDALDAEEEALADAIDDAPLAPLEEVFAEDDVAPLDDPIPAVGVGAPLPPTDAELAAMAREGVQHVRVFVPFPAETDWASPSPAWVAAIDGLVADAARHGIRLLPVLGASEVPDLDDASLTAWGDYAFHLAARYGETGDFWDERPDLEPAPPHAWEVWSEPNDPTSFGGVVDPDHYRALLLYARVGLRDGDPGAKVILGGLAPAGGGVMAPADFVDAVLDAPDAGQLLEGVAVHPFARDATAVLSILGDVRRALDRRGLDAAGIWVTAAGWAVREGGATVVDARDEADRVERLRALLDGVEDMRETLRLGPVFWASHRDLTLAERGGIDGWSGHVGLFDVDGSDLLATERSSALLGIESAALPLTGRPAPGRTGRVRTASSTRQARRDDGNRRRRRARRRHFRRTVSARMFQLGRCVRADATGVQRMKPGCDPWTVPAADTWRVAQHPDLEDRRVAYACSVLRRLRPTLVSGLVRFGREHVLDGDASVQEEIERETRMFRRVRHCVRQPGARERSRRRVRFDVALNALHFTHTQSGVTSAEQGRRWHREVLSTIDPLARPDAWFYDFYADPYDEHRLCYGGHDVACRERDQRFFPDGMEAGIRWIHRNGQWVGGHSFTGREIARGTDYIVLTWATLAEPTPTDGFYALQRERNRLRAAHPSLPIIMHVRNDPQIPGSTGHMMFEGDGRVRNLLRRHFQRQEGIGYGYMAPVFFPLRYTGDRSRPVESFDPRARGLVRFMRRQQRRHRSRP